MVDRNGVLEYRDPTRPELRVVKTELIHGRTYFVYRNLMEHWDDFPYKVYDGNWKSGRLVEIAATKLGYKHILWKIKHGKSL
jgi:hypothetical protein